MNAAEIDTEVTTVQG